MAALEVIALDTVTPQLRAPGAGDTYTFPRAVAMSVPLPVSSGGTGQSTANAALNALLPSQSGQSGKFLTTDGADTSWATAGGGSATLTIQNKTTAYTVVAGDLGTIINCTSGTFTVSLNAAATLGSGFNCWIWNTGNGTITIDPSGAETIEGVATVALSPGEGFYLVCTGASFIAGAQKAFRQYSEDTDNGFALRPVASGTASVAIGTQSTATAAYSIAFRGNSTTSYGTAIGANSSNQRAQAVTGSGAMALGGSYASGTDSFAAAISDNTSTYGATGSQSVALGRRCKASNNNAVALGTLAVASGLNSVAIGVSLTASGSYAVCAGYNTKALGAGSFALGNYSQANEAGKLAFSSAYSGAWNYGHQQYGLIVLINGTTDATAAVLTTTNSAASTTNQVILPNNSAYAFTGTVVARQQASGGTASAAWKIEGLIRREGSAGTTTLVASTVTAIDNTPGWTLALSADTTNGGLAVTATGAAATNIRWVATVQTSEVTYA